MMIKFRKMYPIGSIERGYVAPLHPLPAVIVLVLAFATLVGMYFGYFINILSGFAFYFIASLWFAMHRYKFLNIKLFLSKGIAHWPRPRGY
jgi:ethanolamine permease